MASKTTQRKNIKNEQFYTNLETAERLSSIVKNQPWFSEISKIVEPSAGDGVWLNYLNVDEAYDIEPNHPLVIKQDFLDEEFKIESNGKILFIGNPPFGRMGKIAKKFIEKCADQGDYVAFILPASFGKITTKRQVPKYLHLIYQEELLQETFRFERDGRVVSTVFQIWEKRETPRNENKRQFLCEDFTFLSEKEIDNNVRFDIVICTHGSKVGSIYTEGFTNKSRRTHRFIKVKQGVSKELVASNLKQLDYESCYKFTVGAPCVSTEEIIILYNEKINSSLFT